MSRLERLAVLCVLALPAIAPGAEAPANLLRNTAFLQCANPGVPDWWGTGAPEVIQEWAGCLGTADDAPLPGVRSLCLRVPATAKGISLQSYAYPLPSGREYTFSIYLKAESTPSTVGLGLGDQSRTVTASPEWQRVVFTATPKQGHWAGGRLVVRFGLQGAGSLRVAAPQLEYGGQATPYRPAAADSATAPKARVATPAIPPDAVPLPTAACSRSATAPILDGLLDDACYQGVTWLGDFRDMGSGQPSSVKTEAVVLRDPTCLYIALRCHEPEMAKLVAKVTQRDGPVFGDDSVEVFLQPDPASPDYLHFATNALGTRFDERVFEVGWNPEWKVAAARDGEGWSVEMQILFAGLGLTPQTQETWGLNLCRTRPREGGPEHSQWSCTYMGFHTPARFGRLIGLPRGDLEAFLKAPPTPAVVPAPVAMATPLMATFEWSYYSGEATARLWVESRLDRAGRLRVQLRERRTGAMVDLAPVPVRRWWPSAATKVPAGARQFVCFDIATLFPGTYDGQVRLVDRKGATLAEVPALLTKLSPGRTEVKMHRLNRSLQVDGKPFLVYAQGIHGRRGGWWLEDIAAHGFNTVIAGCEAYRSDDALAKDAAGIRAFLDECASRGLRVILWLHPGAGPYAPIREGVVRTITAFKDHPNILCWYLVDEPEGWWGSQPGGKTEADLVDLRAAARAADPYRPAHINWYAWSKGKGGYGSLDATDIGALDRYPVGRGANAIKATGDIARIMNDDCRPRHQPTAFWVQMYGYDDAVREPTPDEMAGMTYACLIQGMRLIYYFIYKPMSTDLWESMAPLGAELRALEPVLTDPDAREFAVDVTPDGVHYALWQRGRCVTLVACNASDEKGALDLDLKKLGARRVPGKVVSASTPGAVTYGRGRLRAEFAANQRLVVILE